MAQKQTDPKFWHTLWDFFVSVKLTVVLLLTLAATSIIGTLIPQNESPAAYIQNYGEFLYRFFSVLDVFDMYHAWWFQLMMLLLTANIVACSIDRLSATWKLIFPAAPKFNLQRFRKLSTAETFEAPETVDSLVQTYETELGKRFSYSRREKTEQGYAIFLEKWRKTRLGVYIVHFSVILLLIGALIGSIFGFEGFANIAEGESTRTIRLRNENRLLKLDFEIYCEDFDVSFYDTGAPKEFRSTLWIQENGRTVLKKDIIVNDPLRYKGINIFQSSYGKLPGRTPELSFLDKATGAEHTVKTPLGQTVALPGDMGTFELTDYQDEARFKGHPVGAAYIGTLTPPDGEAVQVLLPLRFPSFDRMRRGALIISVADTGERYYTGLQVTRDPGVWVVYIGFILMIAGCFITFFMSHQQVCVELIHRDRQTRVVVSGTANKNKLGMQQKIKRIAHTLKTRSGVEAGGSDRT